MFNIDLFYNFIISSFMKIEVISIKPLNNKPQKFFIGLFIIEKNGI